MKTEDTRFTAELDLNDSITIVLVHLRQISLEKKKLEKLVPHELNYRHRDERLNVCLTLLNRLRNEEILNRIVTCVEKWVLFSSRKRSSCLLDLDRFST